MLKKILFILVIFLYHSNLYSSLNVNKFNQKYLSNYFSGLVSYNNNENNKALKFFNSSKKLLSTHESIFIKYIYSLVENDQITKAINETEKAKLNTNFNFFEANILSYVDNIEKKDFIAAKSNISDIESLQKNDNFEAVISESLKSYTDIFLNKKIVETDKNFGQLSRINSAFQKCYIEPNSPNNHFTSLINQEDGDYSRYLFFYLINNSIINKIETSAIVSTIDPLNSNILISQSKDWIENKKFYKFSEFFSCESEKDILSEFFYIIGNLYSSQDLFIKSNFFLKLSNYLNPKFYFNNSLLAENYFYIKNYDKSLSTLKKINQDDKIYNWYKIKKKAQIIEITEGKKSSIGFIENEIKNYKNPDFKIYYDLANIYKSFEKYEKSIKYYNLALSNINKSFISYGDILYRRGSSYERLKNYEKSDEDLLNSLRANPNDPYVLNYLAYSWLERNYKINEAIEMLLIAYKQKKEDAFIIDSLGWSYYLIKDYVSAESYIRKALQIRPNDPVIMDHYGDILWKSGQKLQARYYWKNVIKINNNSNVNKEDIKNKLLLGLN